MSYCAERTLDKSACAAAFLAHVQSLETLYARFPLLLASSESVGAAWHARVEEDTADSVVGGLEADGQAELGLGLARDLGFLADATTKHIYVTVQFRGMLQAAISNEICLCKGMLVFNPNLGDEDFVLRGSCIKVRLPAGTQVALGLDITKETAKGSRAPKLNTQLAVESSPPREESRGKVIVTHVSLSPTSSSSNSKRGECRASRSRPRRAEQNPRPTANRSRSAIRSGMGHHPAAADNMQYSIVTYGVIKIIIVIIIECSNNDTFYYYYCSYKHISINSSSNNDNGNTNSNTNINANANRETDNTISIVTDNGAGSGGRSASRGTLLTCYANAMLM